MAQYWTLRNLATMEDETMILDEVGVITFTKKIKKCIINWEVKMIIFNWQYID